MPYSLTALQLSDKYKVTTPVNWNQGDNVIVHPSVTTEDAKKLFNNVVEHKASRPRILWQIVRVNVISFPVLPQDCVAACVENSSRKEKNYCYDFCVLVSYCKHTRCTVVWR